MYTDDQINKARQAVKARKGFYKHLMSYVFVNLFLIELNLLTSPYRWFVFPLLGWGLGLAFHYVEVFGIPGFSILSRDWEEQELDKELRKLSQVPRPHTKGLAGHPAKPGTEDPDPDAPYDDSAFV
jgi:hypothetical protein